MRKLVLGIAFVLVLDIAFILLMKEEREVPELAQIVIPNAEESVIRRKPILEPLASTDSDELRERGADPSESGYRPEPKWSSLSARSDSTRPGDKKDQAPSIDRRPLFPEKIIYIGKYEAPEAPDPSMKVSTVRDSVENPAEAAEPLLPKPRKRSFESRAFGVIKKPYHVIKKPLNVIKKPFEWIGSMAKKIGK